MKFGDVIVDTDIVVVDIDRHSIDDMIERKY